MLGRVRICTENRRYITLILARSFNPRSMKSTRRNFIGTSAALVTAGAMSSFAPKPDKPMLVHHVFFWLKNPGSKADRDKLIEGLRTLTKIETVRQTHIGIPASTEKRPVIDSSYSVSELFFFDDIAGEKTYQDHPLHKKFVETYSPLWEKVVVYDSLAI